MSVNKVILIGNLGGDPELKYTPAGAASCKFSIAMSEKWVDKNGQKQEKTEWARIQVWGKIAESCNTYLAKGKKCYVEGSLKTDSWDDKDGKKQYMTYVNARTVQFLSPVAGNQQNGQHQGQTQQQEYNVNTNDQFTADDIPF